jgi:poly-gamma-glutamate synthesis protein (capsule biosynthesis protein)
MRRRDFLRGLAGTAGALALPVSAHGQPPDPALADTLPPAPDPARPPEPGLPAAEPAVTLAVGGDTTLAYNLEAHFDEQVATGVPREQLYPLYFAGIREVMAGADLAVVNLECALAERGEKLPKNFNFRGRRELVEILRQGSVDVVTLANNHTMDYGREGLEDTLATLDGAGIARFGAGLDLAAAREPLVIERNGLRLGFLGYYFQVADDMFEPEAMYARPDRAGVAGCYTDLECMKAMLREDVPALVSRVDAAILYFHWGKEGRYEVRQYQADLAHLAVDLGARAVLGAHPHRLQATEVYRGAPVLYSLGNFVYGGIKDPPDTLTAIARLRVDRRAVTADLVPVRYTLWPDKPFQPVVLEGAEYEAAMRRIAALSSGWPEPLPGLGDWTPATTGR